MSNIDEQCNNELYNSDYIDGNKGSCESSNIVNDSNYFAVITVIRDLISKGYSDIFITEGKNICGKYLGELRNNSYEVSIKDIDNIISSLVNSSSNKDAYYKLRDNDNVMEEIDLSMVINVNGHNRRIRANVFKSMSGMNISMRVLTDKILDFSGLNMPPSIDVCTKYNNGLILIIGATGSGKTSTLASLMEYININQNKRIITLENPIEYVYEPKKCIIEQREIGTHCISFPNGVKSALRQTPNILVIGEMRDLEEIKNSITLAETNHLVYGTLHSNSVVDAIDRMIDVFPPEQQEQIKSQLLNTLRVIVCQNLVKSSIDGRMIPIVEIMVMTPRIANMIKNGESVANIRMAIRNDRDIGSVNIIENIVWHIVNKRIVLGDIVGLVNDEELRNIKLMLSNVGKNR